MKVGYRLKDQQVQLESKVYIHQDSEHSTKIFVTPPISWHRTFYVQSQGIEFFTFLT